MANKNKRSAPKGDQKADRAGTANKESERMAKMAAKRRTAGVEYASPSDALKAFKPR